MLLTNSDQLGHARRNNAKVIVYTIDDAGEKRLDAFGTLFDFEADTITIMSPSVGLVHFLREYVHVQLVSAEA